MITKDTVDIICIGEGEQSPVNLLNTSDQKSSYFDVLGFCFKDRDLSYVFDPLPELDSLPTCDWSCYEGTQALDQLPLIMPIRGCPYSCTYCFNEGIRELLKKSGDGYIRHHSPQRAVEEALSAVKAFQQKSPVMIQSDTIGLDLG